MLVVRMTASSLDSCFTQTRPDTQVTISSSVPILTVPLKQSNSDGATVD